MPDDDKDQSVYDAAAEELVQLGNRLMERYGDADARDIAAGLLAGVVHFWLYARQPCGDPTCDVCSDADTAEKRLHLLLEEARQAAVESDYYHTLHDANVGRA